MIKKPIFGMRVNVDNPLCCNDTVDEDNHGGPGTIREITHDDSFLVKMDSYNEEWYRCRECVTEIASS